MCIIIACFSYFHLRCDSRAKRQTDESQDVNIQVQNVFDDPQNSISVSSFSSDIHPMLTGSGFFDSLNATIDPASIQIQEDTSHKQTDDSDSDPPTLVIILSSIIGMSFSMYSFYFNNFLYAFRQCPKKCGVKCSKTKHPSKPDRDIVFHPHLVLIVCFCLILQMLRCRG